ncbi:MAG: acetylornithine/succinylornithine family transaminase [Myxococcota bacterium]
MKHALSTETIKGLAESLMVPTYAQAPFVVSHGRGSELFDLDGRRYLDFTGGIAVNALGHSHPKVVAAICEQAQKILHTSNLHTHPGYVAMCQRLAELTGGDSIFLTNSGSEAMEAALKLARRHFHDTGSPRTRFVATVNSFHGRTLGAVSVTGQPSYREGYGPLFETQLVPFNDLEAMRSAIDETVAAVVIEPIQGNGGIHVATDAYLQGIEARCRETGSLLIVDEIQTGGGRTGRWWGYEHSGIRPDILTVAKAIGGGMPVGAMVSRRELTQCFTPGSHGSTFGGNPVSCAAGLATLETIATEGLVDRAADAGAAFQEKLRAINSPRVSEVRGRGLMLGVALDGPAKAVRDRARDAGLLITLGGPTVLRVLPPLNASDAEFSEATELLAQALRAV